MADIQYLNYGDQQIEQQALLNKLADNVQQYVANQPWSTKRKEKFMSAYLDIMNHGVTGASNASGRWTISTGGTPIGYDSLSSRDQEMYQEAAYFIQQQMSHLPTRVNEEEKKANLPTFDFNNGFVDYVNRQYGGQPLEIGGEKDQWNWQDERDSKTGLRGREKRAEKLATLLEGYKKELGDGSKYNFEGSPYGNLDEFNKRIDKAIAALRTKDNVNDDRETLAAIGLNAADWFNNGSGDLSGQYITLDDGTQRQLTYAELANRNQQLKKAEDAQIAANRFTGSRRYNISGYNGKSMTQQSMEAITSKLNTFQQLSADELSQLTWAFKNSGANLADLSREEFVKMPAQYRKPHRLKRLIDNNGNTLLQGIYYDTVDGSLVQPYNEGQGSSLQDILSQNEVENSSENSREAANNRKLREGWETEDYARIVAALGDVVSLGGFWANVGGSAVSLIADTTADIADEGLSGWDVVKNLGRNIGWTAAGFIPGAKLGKISKNIARWAPKMLVVLNDYQLLTDASSKNTWNKLTSERLTKEGLTNEDLRNITYWIRAITGTTNAAKSTARDIKYSKARGGSRQEFTTKDGSKVTLSRAEVEEINRTGTNKGQKAAEKLFQQKTGKEVSEGQFSFPEEGRTGIFKNTRSKLQDQRLQGKTVIVRNPTQQKYYDLYSADRRPGRTLGGWRPFWTRGTSSYFDHFEKGEIKNPLKGILGKADPYKKQVASIVTPEEAVSNYRQAIQENPELRNYVNPSEKKLKSETRVPQSNHSQEVLQTLDSSKKITLKHTSNGNDDVFSVEIPWDTKEAIRINNLLKGKGTHEQKKILGQELNKINEKIVKESNLTFKRDDSKWKSYVESIRKLKRLGYLFKEGGKITDSQIDNFLKQYK